MIASALLALTLTATPFCDDPNEIVQKEFAGEYETIVEAAKANDCDSDQLFTVLLAIRKAENGRKGIEFGVLHPRAVDQPNSLRVQAGWCAATIRKTYTRWQKSSSGMDFIRFLGARYCPVDATNDPTGLNHHWVKNVKHWISRIESPKTIQKAYMSNVIYLERTKVDAKRFQIYVRKS